MDILNLLKKAENELGYGIALRLYSDGSGSVFDEMANMNDNQNILFTFDDLLGLEEWINKQ